MGTPARVTQRFAGSSVKSVTRRTAGLAQRDRRSSARIRATSSAKANGLVRTSSAPVLRPLTRSATLGRAPIIKIGVAGSRARSALQTAMPSLPGTSQSSRMRSYSFTKACSSSASPVVARSTAKPSSCSPLARCFAVLRSSSIKRTRMRTPPRHPASLSVTRHRGAAAAFGPFRAD